MSQDSLSLLRVYQYFVALEDLHNYGIDADSMKQILRPEFIQELNVKSFTKDFGCRSRAFDKIMNLNNAMDAWGAMTAWDRKNYPNTVVENKQIFRDFLRLLEDNSIYPIIVFVPNIKKYCERFCHEKVEEIFDFLNDLRRDYRFTFVNFWAMIDIFNYHDFADAIHLNRNGSKKFSAKLNEIIMEMEGAG